LEEAQDIVANNVGTIDKLMAYVMGAIVEKPKNAVKVKT